MVSLSHALSPKLITFFSVFITLKDFAKAHTTLFFLEALFGKASVACFTAFPKLCQLIFAGEMLVGVPCKIFFTFTPVTGSFTVFLTKHALILTALV